MNAPDSQLRRLTDAWHDGTISREDAMRLEERLLSDEGARAYFFEVSELEAALQGTAADLPAQVSLARTPRHGWWRMAAMFVLGATGGALAWKFVGPRPAAPARVAGPDAIITGMMGVAWDGGGPRSVDLSAASSETKIGSGLMEVTFGSGTRAVVEGPAAFRVLGSNAMDLKYGKVVADVPKGAEGFSVTYSEGRIVDLGTEFGVEIGRAGGSANFGVFRGEIEFQPQLGDRKAVRLLENHAILASGESIQSVPFDQSKFTRKLPSREFSWEVKATDPEAMTWDYDISHLVWKPGRYRVICKWMNGKHGVNTASAELLLDGVRVASDSHPGFAGSTSRTADNEYELDIPPDLYRRGVWRLRMAVQADREPPSREDSAGVVLVEEGFALNARAADFVGTWEYLHDGKVFRRTYHADGKASLLIDGADYPVYATSHWSVADGVLTLDVQEGDQSWTQERQLLRNPDTMVFTNCPYRDAHRVP